MSKKSMMAFRQQMATIQNNRNTNDIFKAFLIIASYSLHENHNFGYAKIEHFMEKVNETIDYLNDGYITMDDISEVLQDECGITVKNRHRVDAKIKF